MTDRYVVPPLSTLNESLEVRRELIERIGDREGLLDQARRLKEMTLSLLLVLEHHLSHRVGRHELRSIAAELGEHLGRRADQLELPNFSLGGLDQLLAPLVALHLLSEAYRDGRLRPGCSFQSALAVWHACDFGFGKDCKPLQKYGRTWKRAVFRTFKRQLRAARHVANPGASRHAGAPPHHSLSSPSSGERL